MSSVHLYTCTQCGTTFPCRGPYPAQNWGTPWCAWFLDVGRKCDQCRRADPHEEEDENETGNPAHAQGDGWRP